ncbi:2-(3-amino-3-carboxypropyl)histidine synthase subunit 2 isoform X3 [Ochotona curzoniae]|uniref:2-(3-amino-3-carboxypropyl)histidine synthase subunit 2 isoform X3 n=1 Tax=Ochotona curzoniae TaxID=130825 RepID=UPI001B34A1E6|nr:2-(3-amino-3-carboxypropyl)histidine synthase subunit 2 isoform X3 [Ochotona curzoniae]
MESTFSSPAEAALQREAGDPALLTPVSDLDQVYELERVAAFIGDLDCPRVALQFPDRLLGDARAVATRLEQATGSKMFILGDTAYGSCCVDVLGAEQAGAQALVHFGPACLSPPSRPLPIAFVLGHRPVALELCAKAFETQYPDTTVPVALLSEPACAHAMDTGQIQDEGVRAGRLRARRYYLVERARDARVVGLLVGTLGVAQYREALAHLRSLTQAAGKRSYVLALGRLTPAKLANFPEMDVFVLLACPLGALASQPSGSFFRPVLMPSELEAACNPAWPPPGLAPHLTHYADLLPGSSFHVPLPPPESELWDTPDVSLISGDLRPPPARKVPEETGCSALTPRPQLALAESSPAASFLNSRSWKGLEPRLGQTPATGAVSGRRGIAIAYEDEGSG